jgi:DNA primase
VLWQKMVSDAADSIAFFLKKLVGGATSLDPFAKKRVGDEILPLVARLNNEIERAHWMRELGRVLHISEEALWRELEKHKTKTIVSPDPQSPVLEATEPTPPSRKGRLEERIAGLLLLEPRFATLCDMPAKADCSLSVTGELFEHLTKHLSSTTISEIISGLPEDVQREAGRFLFEAEIFATEGVSREEEFLNLTHAWRELSLKEKLARLREEIEHLEYTGKKEESQEHLQEFNRLTAHLADVVTLHSYYNDKKNKKEKRF